MSQKMTSSNSSAQAQGNTGRVLLEAKSFQQTRERTFLPWNGSPCRMKMVRAGWFAVRVNGSNELATVCLYCKVVCKNWTIQDDPERVHRMLSPHCPFVQCDHGPQVPQSPPINSMPRQQRIRPSTDQQALRFQRSRSFEQWSSGAPCPPFDTMVEAGFFYTGANAIIRCFFCNGEMRVTRADDAIMTAHELDCGFSQQLSDEELIVPLNIQPSEKTYELIEKQVNDTIFYLLRCSSIDPPTPSILLAVNTIVSDDQSIESPDKYLKRLHPSDQLEERVNWATGSDGPLVKILDRLANDAGALLPIPVEQRSSSEISSVPTNLDLDLRFRCRSCLTLDASPHSVPIRCRHIGLCHRMCSENWMTCVKCGHTRGRTLCIWKVT